MRFNTAILETAGITHRSLHGARAEGNSFRSE